MNLKHETETGSEFISSTHVRHVMRYARISHLLCSYIKDMPNVEIIDAACGTGYGTNIIADTLLDNLGVNAHVLGVDFCDEALEYAQCFV